MHCDKNMPGFVEMAKSKRAKTDKFCHKINRKYCFLRRNSRGKQNLCLQKRSKTNKNGLDKINKIF